MVLESEVPPELDSDWRKRYRRIERISTYPRIQKVLKKDFIADQGHEPKVGQILYYNGEAEAEVVDVDDTQVTEKLNPDGIFHLKTNWGVEVSKVDGDTVKGILHTEPGTLVRTVSLIGRISKVTDDTIIVDYGHPFGGYPLECSVDILDAEEKVAP